MFQIRFSKTRVFFRLLDNNRMCKRLGSFRNQRFSRLNLSQPNSFGMPNHDVQIVAELSIPYHRRFAELLTVMIPAIDLNKRLDGEKLKAIQC